MKQALQFALDTLLQIHRETLEDLRLPPKYIGAAIIAAREALAKHPTCYIKPEDVEYMKQSGIRLAEVSNVALDAWTVPLGVL